ncbi:unnamed protein product [Phytophthora fragariaefolia]|uniref:Unnamed protein product n=1 Tax=Phytophthora fragariaefolia TaxID=1490495 RepID=A0A9W6YC61_9STRA|nr:unnamed protein product [Phytophthora fragariaefolia]
MCAEQKTQIRSDLRGSRSVKGDAVVAKVVDTQVEQEEPGTEDSDLGASAPGADAIVSARDRDAARSVCREDTATGDNRRDPEWLDAYGYWSPVSEDGAREPSDASGGVDLTSSYELEAFRPRPARWTHRADLHPLGRREDESEAEELKQLVTEGADALSAKSKKERFDEQSWDSLKSSLLYEVLREYKHVLPDDIRAELPQDKGVQHEIDLVPGTKYCVTRQWPLPQVKANDDFFESRRKAGQLRESKSPHTAPTFCVKKEQGGWRIVHAYNKLNDATVPAQTPIPRKDVIIGSMALSTIFSALDLRDGFYQTFMRESDIPLTAVSTPSGMLWEWLVMPQGLKNAPATFNRCVTHLLRSVRDFAPSYFDDVFIHSKSVNGKSDTEISVSSGLARYPSLGVSWGRTAYALTQERSE